MSTYDIVCCARQDYDSAGLMDSIEDNCGCEWIDSMVLEEVGHKSMGAGYNAATRKSDADVLVFTHTDVRLWAGPALWQDMLERAALPTAGFVGVAGTSRLDETAVWWNSGHKAGAVAHTDNKANTYVSSFGPFGDCVVLDGVFLACRRTLIEELGWWPEDTGFHFYDIEMTLKAHLAGYINTAVALPLLHGSVGAFDKEWHKAREFFLARYEKKLPISL